jgi:tRNA(adenine34) deaminase
MGCLGGATPLHALPKLNHRVNVTSGILEEPCREILQAYFNLKRGKDLPPSA